MVHDEHPAMVRVTDGSGVPVHVEVWSVPAAGLAGILLKEPPGLAIGKLRLADGSTMLVRHGSTGRIMANWLEDDPRGARTFEVGNENFAPDSATLTHEGWEHLAQFSQMLKAHHTVRAEILYSARHGIAGTTELEHMRADRIHDEAVNQGVDEEQIVVAREGFEAGHNTRADEGLEVVLINRV